jgi:hypothetical protein
VDLGVKVDLPAGVAALERGFSEGR